MKREFIYIGVIIVLLLLVFNNKKAGLNNDIITKDSTKVEIVTPKSSGQFLSKNPDPIIIKEKVVVSDSLKYKTLIASIEKKYNRAADSITILKELLKAKTIREYKKTYEDSLLIATIYEKTEGTLLERKFNYELKPQKITYYNTNTTIQKYPDYAFYLGAYTYSDTSFNNSIFGLDVSYQGKNGSIFTVGYGTKNSFLISFNKRIFVKY